MSILPTTPQRILYEALICGVDIPNGDERRLFIDTGLIHVMVVSGSHLVFLELLMEALPNRVRLAILSGYSYLVGFQAPVMRALLRRLVGPHFVRRIGLTTLQVEAATAVIALLLYPPWLFSRSFLMSWMCGLALCTPRLIPSRPNLDLAMKCYFFMLPFCGGSPTTILWNATLAPLVGFVLFPSCLVAILVPPLHVLADFVWLSLLWILQHGPQAEPALVFYATARLWWLPPTLHLFLLIAEVKWRRAYSFSW